MHTGSVPCGRPVSKYAIAYAVRVRVGGGEVCCTKETLLTQAEMYIGASD